MKKLSTIFIALTAIALLFTPSCKSEDVFNIAGHWSGSLFFDGYGTLTATYDFTGTELSGTAVLHLEDGEVATGTYTVTGLNVSLNLTWNLGASHVATGTAGADFLSISGTFTQNNGWSGTWNITRPSAD